MSLLFRKELLESIFTNNHKTLTESVNFKNGDDQDYTHHKEVLMFYSKDCDDYKQFGNIHGLMSHSLKHMREFEPTFVDSLVENFRVYALIYIDEQFDARDELDKAIRNGDKISELKALSKIDDDFEIYTCSVVGKRITDTESKYFRRYRTYSNKERVFATKEMAEKKISNVSKHVILNYFDCLHDKVSLKGKGALTDFEEVVYNKYIKPIAIKYKSMIERFDNNTIDIDEIDSSTVVGNIKGQELIDYYFDNGQSLKFGAHYGNMDIQVAISYRDGIFSIIENGRYITFFKIKSNSINDYYSKVKDKIEFGDCDFDNILVRNSLQRF